MNFRETIRAVERTNRQDRRELDAHLDRVELALGVRSTRTDSLDDDKQSRTSPGGKILSFTRPGTVPAEDHTDAIQRIDQRFDQLEQKMEQHAESVKRADRLREIKEHLERPIQAHMLGGRCDAPSLAQRIWGEE